MTIPRFGEIAEQLRRATVVIQSRGHGGGSGVIWPPGRSSACTQGIIVTNAHVVQGGKASVQLWDGREFEAAVTSRDRRRDLAVLRLDTNVFSTGVPVLAIADSSAISAGEIAIAIGNPLGFVGALTTGVIHAVGPVRGLSSQSWVQAELRLAPGNSGGPLANARGGIIGINTMVAGRLAFAVPSNEVKDFLAAGAVEAWLGVTVHPVHIPGSQLPGSQRQSNSQGGAETFGLVVLEIEPGSPAATASLLPGDILLGTPGVPFATPADLANALRASHSSMLRLEFLRGSYANMRRVTVQLAGADRPDSAVAA